MPSTATNRLQGLTTSVAVKPPCITVATSNIALSGLQTILGVTVVEGDRVLVRGQSIASENGIYNASTGQWQRAKDFDGALDAVSGTRVLIRNSGIDGVEYELTTPGHIAIGTTALTFALRYGANATYDQTEAEIAAGVTPTYYSANPLNGEPLRYGQADGDDLTDSQRSLLAKHINDSSLIAGRKSMSARAFSQRAFHENRTWNLKTDFGAIGDFSTVNDAAFGLMINSVADGDTVEIPIGIFNFKTPIELTKRVNFVGQSKFRSVLYAVDFGLDVAMINYQGTSVARLQDIELRNIRFGCNNQQARALGLTWVNKSVLDGLYFYELYRGATLDHAWGNNWRSLTVFDIDQETLLIGDQVNACHFDKCEARSNLADAIKITGACAGLHFTSCDIEGVETASKAGILIAPTTGKAVEGITIGGYFERIKGNAIKCAGIDANSVRGLHIQPGSYFFGGHAAYYSSAAGSASIAIALANVGSFEASGSHFYDWETAAFSRDGTELNGRVWNNTAASCPALTSSSNLFSTSVDVQNNFAGLTNPYLVGSATLDPASLSDGVGVTTTVTVTGAALGDYVRASFSNDLQGITLSAWVSSANTVSVRLQNESGGVLDLASGTLRARVTKAA